MRAAADRLRGVAIATPLIPFEHAGRHCWLKLENLQASGSFKLRTAGNQLLAPAGAEAHDAVYTASTGNLGIATAWLARRLGIAATVLVPPHAPEDKLAMLHELGASVERLAADEWWQVILARGQPQRAARYIDADGALAIAGAATIGLEIATHLPDPGTVYCAYGGGALACGLWAGISSVNTSARVIGCELETATPLTAALAAGRPVDVPFEPSFVSGMGSTSVLPSLWPLVRDRLAGSAVVSLAEVRDVIRLLAERHGLVVEGAAAVAVAAALRRPDDRPAVCVVSGGNLGSAALREILAGRIPAAG